MFYLEIGSEGEVENQTHLGHLCCDVDAAFDILDIGHEGGDLLLAAGNMGDGGLFVQKARDHPRCVQKFLNWAPVTDSVLVSSASQGPLAAEIASDRLFACSASTFGQGAVVELRYGIEAQIGLVIQLEDLSSTRDIWTMPDSVDGGVYILTSDPVSSILFYLPPDFGEEICAIDEANSGLNFSAQTLAAGCTPDGVVIQVTEKAIHLGAITGSLSNFRFDYDPNQSAAVAAVNDSTSSVVAIVRTSHEFYIHTTRATSLNGQLQLYDIDGPIKIDHEPAQEVERSDDISKAIESLATIKFATEGSLGRSILFCGLRSGILVPFEVSVVGDSPASPIEMRQTTPQQLGHTSVRVQGRGNFALLTCGEGFWQVSCIQDGELPDYALERIWITDQNNPAYYPKNIHGFTINNVVNPQLDGLPDSLFCITDGSLLICTLDQVAKPVPRRIGLPGSVRKIAYSKYLRSLIVAYTQTDFDTDTDPIKRYTRPFIEFVDPDSQESVVGSPAENESRAWRPQGAAGEKITCILEWTPRKGDEEYHFIIIGTSRRNQQERGRVIFLQASRDESNPSLIDCSVKYIHKFEGPVFAIAPYGDLTLMVSTGREIVPLEPKFSQTRWPRTAKYSGSYPAVSMTAHEPFLYMSTSRESLMVLKVVDDNLNLHSYDRQKHDGLSHVHVGGEMKLTTATSRGGRVSIFTGHGVTDNDKMMPVALCEAHLPLSVTKLCTGSKPSPLSPYSPVLYGTTINGTAYRFLTLGEKEWQVLRLLQNLCERDSLISPFTPRRKRQRNPVGSDPSQFSSSRMHIDGDILSRLVARGSGHLKQMLATNEFDNPSWPEAGSAQTTMERFSELSKDLLGENPSPVDAVMRWLRNSLYMGF
ncbi:hypothetical protein MW887_010371 [Aspergillus wentii]|nr:hypothetical protein MW887_010371 [Aspergillus wentii]